MKKLKGLWGLIELKIEGDPDIMWYITESDRDKLLNNRMGISLLEKVNITECTLVSVFENKKDAKAAWKQKQYFSTNKCVYFIHKMGDKTNPKYYKKWLF